MCVRKGENNYFWTPDFRACMYDKRRKGWKEKGISYARELKNVADCSQGINSSWNMSGNRADETDESERWSKYAIKPKQ